MAQYEIQGVYAITKENASLVSKITQLAEESEKLLLARDALASTKVNRALSEIERQKNDAIKKLATRYKKSALIPVTGRTKDRKLRNAHAIPPNKALNIWEHPSHKSGTDESKKRLVGMFVNLSKNAEDKIIRTPEGFVGAELASLIVVYKKGCCPDYSIMVKDGSDRKAVILDSMLTHKNERQLLAGKFRRDRNGVLAHAADHIRGTCKNHASRPAIAMPS